jgi:hypothetical protein
VGRVVGRASHASAARHRRDPPQVLLDLRTSARATGDALGAVPDVEDLTLPRRSEGRLEVTSPEIHALYGERRH